MPRAVKLGEPSLDQIRIFLAVVDHGSFGGAARQMGRTVSAISYGIAQMEAQLGLSLFDREGSRKPVLTVAGRGLLPEAQAVADHADSLLAKTRGIHEGLESDVGLVVDVMVPGAVTAEILRGFREQFPTVALRLQVEGLGAVAAALLETQGRGPEGGADLAIGGPLLKDYSELEREEIGEIALVPVAAPDHPLATERAAPGEARKHLQLVLSDRSSLSEGREFAVFGSFNWRLGDLGAKHDLLRQGIGWGNIPRPMVADDLAKGALVELDLPEKPGAQYRLSAIWRRDSPLGPATKWLIGAFQERL